MFSLMEKLMNFKMVTLLVILAFVIPAFSFSEVDARTEGFYSNVVSIARASVGMASVPAWKGQVFTCDCIGFIRYVYFKAGIDLIKAYGIGRGGVSSLYDGLEKYGFVYDAKTAQPGDLIFFDNTYDVNGDGKWDDPLSHIGIISGYGKHNTLFYIHFAGGAVNEDHINLVYPNTHGFKQKDGNLYVINSYLRMNRGEGFAQKDYVASFFYHSFAHVRIKVKPGT